MAKHTVKQGECISSIADKYGFFWETLWNLSENTELKQKRKEPNILHPGDEVFIPDKREKTESGSTEQRHRFRRKGVPSKLSLRFMSDGEPRANQPYRIDINGGQTIEGTLDAEGKLETEIPGNADIARVFIGKPGEETMYELELGSIDPITELSGVQDRLNNIGYACEREEKLGESTRSAIRAFQKAKKLEATGRLDEKTREALVDAHGC